MNNYPFKLYVSEHVSKVSIDYILQDESNAHIRQIILYELH